MFETISSASTLLAQAANGDTTEVAWYQSGYAMFAILLLILFGSWALGRAIAKSLRMDDYATKLAVIIGCLLISTLVVSTKWPPKFGIDLRGGMNLIGELNLDDLDSGQNDYGAVTQTTAKDIIPILVRRVDPSGTREIMIRPLGTDKIEVTIPTDSEQEADEIWTLSRVDEQWQEDQWGFDEEAGRQSEIKRQAFLHAKRFYDVSG